MNRNSFEPLSGYRVEHHRLMDARPKMQLRDETPVSDEFRVKMNAWLADFFGYWPELEPVLQVESRTIVCGTRAFNQLMTMVGKK